MLIQRKLESGRSPLASITRFSGDQVWDDISTSHWRLVEGASAETATGFKKENTLGGSRSLSPRGSKNKRTNWLRKK